MDEFLAVCAKNDGCYMKKHTQYVK